jgi:hypothetical protein
MKLCAHCGQAIVVTLAPKVYPAANANNALPLEVYTAIGPNVAGGAYIKLDIRDYVVYAARAIFVLLALTASLSFADAPAPSPKPQRPRAVATPQPSPTPPEPFDLAPVDAPGEPQPDSTPAPSPSPSPIPLTPVEEANDRGFEYDVQAGALMTVTGEAGTDITPTLWINTSGPLALGSERSWGRVGARLGLSTAPGETQIDLSSLNYKAAEVGLWAGYIIGRRRDVETTLVIEGDFASRIKGTTEPAPGTRLARAAGLGVRFDARESNASMTLLGGFDESTASCVSTAVCTGVHSGFAFMIYGQLPIVRGAVLLTGDCSLSIGGDATWLTRRDILRLGLVIDPVQAVKVLRGEK